MTCTLGWSLFGKVAVSWFSREAIRLGMTTR
jgi:hypothetical protein